MSESHRRSLYDRYTLLTGLDEDGRYWDIYCKDTVTVEEVHLRETDMVELADWIARELGWIKRKS
jgi:hypothetical protein